MEQSGVARGVVVLGMHRSGTSAVTGVIDALGLPACRAEDRFPPRKWNARGNFESRSLTLFDEQLLNFLGGTWWAPPMPPKGWADRLALEGWRITAEYLFGVAHPTRAWVWKDPRACVLMPFWDRVLRSDPLRIVVLRNPLESAASLNARDGMELDHALALAERSLRVSLRDSAGRAVMITSYDELLDDLDDWCRRAASFITDRGVQLPDPIRVDDARSLLDDSLRHHREHADLSSAAGASAALGRLWNWALERRGAHEALSVRGLPRESPATAARLKAALSDFRPVRRAG